MGSSRRQKKKQRSSTHSKVRVGLPKIKADKPPRAVTLPGADSETVWDVNKTQKQNFAAIGLSSDSRVHGGRNRVAKKMRVNSDGEEEEEEVFDGLDPSNQEATYKSDAYCELRAICGKERLSGKALPKRLTTNQRSVVEALVKAHGSDFGAMARDRKLNRLQHAEGVLRNLIKSYNAYPTLAGGGHRGFHAPKKSC